MRPHRSLCCNHTSKFPTVIDSSWHSEHRLDAVTQTSGEPSRYSEAGRSDRRRRPRIEGPFSARARGIDSNGAEFDIETALDNLSAGGLHVRLMRPVSRQTKLFFIIQLPAAPGAGKPGMRVATHGVVRRVERLADGSCGLGVEFKKYREL